MHDSADRAAVAARELVDAVDVDQIGDALSEALAAARAATESARAAGTSTAQAAAEPVRRHRGRALAIVAVVIGLIVAWRVVSSRRNDRSESVPSAQPVRS